MAFTTLDHVVKEYQMGEVIIKAVEDISFEINKGEFAIIADPLAQAKRRC